MPDHPQFAEDIDLYALGVLEGVEKQALEAHLTRCDDCQRKLDDARGLVAMVSLAAPPLAPPAGTRERMLESVRARRRVAVEAGAERPSFWRWPNLGWGFAVAALLVGMALVAIDNRRMSREEAALQAALEQQTMQLDKTQAALDILRAPDTQRVRLVSGEARRVPEGKVFYHSQRGLLFFASNLPPLEKQKTYELWLIPAEGNPVNAGTFEPDARGEGSVLLPVLPPHVVAKAFAVTIEPAGGVAAPTGPRVLAGGV
jgi:anti-sigma-K factor RskA